MRDVLLNVGTASAPANATTDAETPDPSIYEMEDGFLSGPQIASNHAGYTGTGFVDYINSTGDYVELTVNRTTGGSYDLSFRYALGSGDRPLEIKVNGQVVAASLSFPATGAWTTWGYTATVPVTLNAGDNTVRATAIGSSGANVDHLLVESTDAVKLAIGVVNNVGSSWTNVPLANSYTSMVVVATPNYDNTSDPAVVRIRNATGSSFDVRVDAAGGATPSSMDVHYMVVEEGVYTVAADGVKMEAVKYNSTVTDENNSWVGQARTYSNTYTSPVVLGQVMTYNDSDFSAFWCSDGNKNNPPSNSSLYTGKMVGEDPDNTRADETIGYIVIESGSGTLNGVNYVTALGSDSIEGFTNSPPYTYSISGLSTASAAIASQAGMDGGNGGWVALYGSNPVSATSINLAIDEDVANDTERTHLTEQVGYIVFE